MKPDLASENKGFCSGFTIAACCSASAIIALPTVPGANPGFPLCWTLAAWSCGACSQRVTCWQGPCPRGPGTDCWVAPVEVVPSRAFHHQPAPADEISAPHTAQLMDRLLHSHVHRGAVVVGPCRCGMRKPLWQGKNHLSSSVET